MTLKIANFAKFTCDMWLKERGRVRVGSCGSCSGRILKVWGSQYCNQQQYIKQPVTERHRDGGREKRGSCDPNLDCRRDSQTALRLPCG